MQTYTDIFEYITAQENAFMTPVQLIDGYEWSFRKHVQLSILYKNSRYETGNQDNKPFKNIIRPLINFQKWAEGFDVKDISLFVNDPKNFFKSFLIKKFHHKWARDNKIDTFIDEVVDSYIDFGGTLIKKIKGVRPEVIQLQSIAFCDQTDILSGPIALEHFFSPDQLMDMESFGWGSEANGADITLEELVQLSDYHKENKKENGTQALTPGTYIKIYEIHGNLPSHFLNNESDRPEKNLFTRQLQIVGFYQKEDGTKQGVTLFKGKESDQIFKFLARDAIFGRALGFGGIEELFEPQVWTNFNIIHHTRLIEAASKVLLKSTDSAVVARHPTGLKDLENLEVIELQEGKDIGQLDTYPRSAALFEKANQDWEIHANKTAVTNNSGMGISPPAGTSGKLLEADISESHSLHEDRRGKIASFFDEVWKDWVIPQIARDITKGQEFMADLDLNEMHYVADALVTGEAERMKKEKVLNGENAASEDDIEQYKQKVRDEFMAGGSKRFMKILKNELKDSPIDVEIDIGGKQKNLSKVTEKMFRMLGFMISLYNPQTNTFPAFDDPRVMGYFNQITENEGLSPVDFYLPQSRRPQPTIIQPPTANNVLPIKTRQPEQASAY